MIRLESFVAALVLASAYLLGGRFRAARFPRRRRWLSAAAGASIGYVFVDMLPGLARAQHVFTQATTRLSQVTTQHEIYLAGLAGFVVFYGLDDMVFWSRRAGATVAVGRTAYWAHMAGAGLYSVTISYLMVHEQRHPIQLALYCLAMSLHFLSLDHLFREVHGRAYERTGKWVLIGAVMAGWALGMSMTVSPARGPILLGFISGGVVMNTVLAELPTDTQGRFLPFCSGALVYSLILLVASATHSG